MNTIKIRIVLHNDAAESPFFGMTSGTVLTVEKVNRISVLRRGSSVSIL